MLDKKTNYPEIAMNFTILAIINDEVKEFGENVWRAGQPVILKPWDVIGYPYKLRDKLGYEVINKDEWSANRLLSFLAYSNIFEKTGENDAAGYPVYALQHHKLCASDNMQLMASLAAWLGVEEPHEDINTTAGTTEIFERML